MIEEYDSPFLSEGLKLKYMVLLLYKIYNKYELYWLRHSSFEKSSQ